MSLRLLMTTDCIGGVWTYSMELARALASHGVEVHLATMGPSPSDDQREHARRLGNVTLHESTFRLEWMDDPWKEVDRAGDWLLNLERIHSPDLVHLNGYSHAVLPFHSPVLVVGHSCVFSWWRSTRRSLPDSSYRTYYTRVRSGLHAADVVVAPTAAFLSEITRLYGPLAGARVIHNGIETSSFSPFSKEMYVAAAGRIWDEAKNISLLSGIAGKLAWPVCIAGEPEQPDGRCSNLTDLRHLGQLTNGAMRDFLGRAAICAHPARYEPFGLLPLEAALSGCALVLGDIPTLREVWGDAALYVDPFDTKDLEDTLLALISLPPLRKHMAARASARALRYNSRVMSLAYMGAYRSMTPKRAGVR